jgi:hypothetical protein
MIKKKHLHSQDNYHHVFLQILGISKVAINRELHTVLQDD